MATYLRFEKGQEDKISTELGPFPFVQLTYESLRVGPDGDEIAACDPASWWVWPIGSGQQWSDVIIYDKSE